MNDSILLITSNDPKRNEMGTGFVVDSDENGSFVLTCNHVLEAVGKPKIDDYEVKIVVQSELYDMALLRVKGLVEKPFVLKEQSSLDEREVSFSGYRRFKKVHRLNPIEAIIFTNGRHKNNNIYFNVWEIISKEKNEILRGYSGSPLLFDGKVIGIMTDRESKERGFAINIKHLADIWENMPLNLKPINPFVGLRAFRKEDIKHFFGRDKEIDDISSKLEDNNFLAVVGDSGSGKSSVIKAGLIPLYESKGYAIVEMRPANDPFIEFKSEIGRISKGLKYTSLDITNHKKEIHIDNTFENIRSILEQIFQEKYKVVLLYIDQFEELFTSYSDKSEENQKKFLGLLLYLAKNQSSELTIKILFTMRSDYYSLLKKYKIINHIEDKHEANKYIIKRMEDDKLKETIYKPLIVVDLLNEVEAKEFAEFVVKGMGSKDNEITLLQIAMTQTYNSFEESKDLFDAYRKIGSVSGALQELATKTMEAIDNKEILKTIFIRLIHFDKDKFNHTRRVADKSEFSNEQWKLIQLLSSALNSKGEISKIGNEKLGRLLKLSKVNDESNQTVELIHEALITGWTKYNDWIGEVEYFKSLHDIVITKTKAYNSSTKEHNFLLMGNDLDDSKSLLVRQYRDFLSEDEKLYLLESKKFEEEEKQKQNELIKNLIIEKKKNEKVIQRLEVEKAKGQKKIKLLFTLLGILGVLIIVSLYFKYEADKSKDKVVDILKDATNGAIVVLQKNDVSNVRLSMAPIVKEFKYSKDIKIQRIVSQAWFVKARAIEMRDYNKGLHEYIKLIKHFRGSTDVEILKYVAKSLHNKGRFFYDINKSTIGNKVYDNLITNFRHIDNEIVLYEVAKAWYRKGAESKNIEQLKVFLSFVTFFKGNTNGPILKEVAKGNVGIGWVKLINKKYDESIKFTKKGLDIYNEGFWMEINLAHAYLLRNKIGDIVKAKILYLKYKDKREDILKEFEDLKKYGLETINYQYIDDYLLMINKRNE